MSERQQERVALTFNNKFKPSDRAVFTICVDAEVRSRYAAAFVEE
jgi:hypothetical protein